MNPLALSFSGPIPGLNAFATTLGTTFEQPMVYPQKQMTIESCSYPAAGFSTVSGHMVKQTPSG
jgi:hypothetical protein